MNTEDGRVPATAGYVHIYAPPIAERKLHSGTCHDCKRRSWFASFFQEWHGWHSTCLRCGRQWDDGEWLSLPFVRGARGKVIASAKSRWRRTANSAGRQALPTPSPEHPTKDHQEQEA